MTHFPDLPPLPDLSLPIKKAAEQIASSVHGLEEADKAGSRIQDAAKIAKDGFEKFLKRKPFT